MAEGLNFEGVLFDLDGTLLDTLKDLADSMNKALEQLGFESHPAEAYRKFVGDGVRCEAERALPEGHREEGTIDKCVAIARQEYHKCWADNTAAYNGVAEMLDGIEKVGLPMAVLSNKPDDFVQLMVDKLLGEWDFTAVAGVKADSCRKPDPEQALKITEKIGVPPERILYLGDTDTDMQTAAAAGMYAVGALWGFRDSEELLANGAKKLVASPVEVLRLLSNRD